MLAFKRLMEESEVLRLPKLSHDESQPSLWRVEPFVKRLRTEGKPVKYQHYFQYMHSFQDPCFLRPQAIEEGGKGPEWTQKFVLYFRPFSRANELPPHLQGPRPM